jgi:hypothetical protein
LDALPLFTSGRVRLLDSKRLVSQFAALERRTSSIGKDRVDHGPGGKDDLCNAAAGALVLAATTPYQAATPVFGTYGRQSNEFGTYGNSGRADGRYDSTPEDFWKMMSVINSDRR